MKLNESINDKYLFKAIFLAGGAGSGKSTVAKSLIDVYENNDLAFEMRGLTPSGDKGKDEEFKKDLTINGQPSYKISNENIAIVNSDDIYELLLAKNKVSNKIVTEEENPELNKVQQGIRKRAKELTKKKKYSYINGMLPLLIDGTGQDFDKTMKEMDSLEALGYDVYMIYVDVDEDTSLKRNRSRSRSLSDTMVKEIWKNVHGNKEKYETLLGDRFKSVDNNDRTKVDENSNEVLDPIAFKKYMNEVRKIGKQILNSPLENRIGKEKLRVMRITKKKYLNELEKTSK